MFRHANQVHRIFETVTHSCREYVNFIAKKFKMCTVCTTVQIIIAPILILLHPILITHTIYQQHCNNYPNTYGA